MPPPCSYSPDTSESFIPNLVHSVYTTSLSGLLPHRLSLFFMMLTIGTAVDCNPPQTQLTADRYHNLARAALCETAVIDDPSFDTVNTLVSSSLLLLCVRCLPHDLDSFIWYGIS